MYTILRGRETIQGQQLGGERQQPQALTGKTGFLYTSPHSPDHHAVLPDPETKDESCNGGEAR
jgi:hypothetical protein